MNEQVLILIFSAAIMFSVIGGLAFLAHYYTLNGIKSKTVGDGQHGVARFADKKEMQSTYQHIPFDVPRWRKGENFPKEQGLGVGSTSKRRLKNMQRLSQKQLFLLMATTQVWGKMRSSMMPPRGCSRL